MAATGAKALLLILDGAGLDEPRPDNAVTPATMPTWFGAMAVHGHAVLEASGPPVGLDEGQVGNSEVGHLTIGAGYLIPSTLARIQSAYRDGTWSAHPLWRDLAAKPRLHIVGLLSDAGVHGHLSSLIQAATIASAHGAADIIVHPVLDGIDSQAGSAVALLAELRQALATIARTRIGLVMGRRWFCDRGGNLALTRDFTAALSGAAELPAFTDAALATHLATASEASFAAHAGSSNYAARPGETVLLTQHRADRAMQVATVLAETQMVCSLVELGTTIPAERVFFPTRPLAQGLAFELKARAIGSVRISETCKFPHVTYFINGLNRNLEGTQICLPSIPETEIASRPEMSIEQVHAAITAALEDPDNRVVIANIPNLDQVGHLGNFDAAAVAAFHVDRALAAILETCRRHGWTAIVTADHGNADRTRDEAGRPFGSHTGRPVPFTVVPAPDVRFAWTAKTGSLANVAPTLLAALDLPRPAYMTGSLIARAT